MLKHLKKRKVYVIIKTPLELQIYFTAARIGQNPAFLSCVERRGD